MGDTTDFSDVAVGSTTGKSTQKFEPAYDKTWTYENSKRVDAYSNGRIKIDTESLYGETTTWNPFEIFLPYDEDAPIEIIWTNTGIGVVGGYPTIIMCSGATLKARIDADFDYYAEAVGALIPGYAETQIRYLWVMPERIDPELDADFGNLRYSSIHKDDVIRTARVINPLPWPICRPKNPDNILECGDPYNKTKTHTYGSLDINRGVSFNYERDYVMVGFYVHSYSNLLGLTDGHLDAKVKWIKLKK